MTVQSNLAKKIGGRLTRRAFSSVTTAHIRDMRTRLPILLPAALLAAG
jgi:hypothetical protein